MYGIQIILKVKDVDTQETRERGFVIDKRYGKAWLQEVCNIFKIPFNSIWNPSWEEE